MCAPKPLAIVTLANRHFRSIQSPGKFAATMARRASLAAEGIEP